MVEDTSDEALLEGLVALLAKFEIDCRTRILRRENPYSLHLISVLLPRGEKGLKRADVIDVLRERRSGLGLTIPRSFDESVQSAFQRFCGQSMVFIQRGASESEALFRWPIGKMRVFGEPM